MYSAYWCPHCHEQKEMFGKEAASELVIIECAVDGQNSQSSLCERKGITGYPTWEVNGQLTSGIQPLKELAELSDYKGQLVAVYFGFMSCPDACPTALSSLAAAMRSLNAAQQSQIQPLFISVDPERDTLDSMAAYTAYFYPSMKGLSGDLPYLEQLSRQYGAYFQHIPMEDSALGYTVDHTSRIYLIDRKGKLITTIPHATPVADIAAQLQQYL